MRRIITLFWFILTWVCANATHIVGGDFYYTYLSGNKYQITMKLYIDCYNGNPGAISEDEYAHFGIFDANTNAFIDSLRVKRTGPEHVTGAVYKCLVNPGNVCVDQYTYVFEKDLPQRKGGYIIAFQRCCRNITIKNIVNPTATGATYWVHIPDRDLVNIDNSPVFNLFPPIYVCNNFLLKFDHSATDNDGDSLSYELYQPFLGANSTLSRPRPPRNPPFQQVVWNTPYSTADPMGGNPSLAINAVTGELTVTPNTLGQFVIGVKVKEWRQGILIGETLRDYQFNVVDCQASVVALFKSSVQCTDTVQFLNRSVGATNVSWDFGDPASGVANNISNQSNPTHVYATDGEYTVTLKAWNVNCEDEYTLKIQVSKPSHAGFLIREFTCQNHLEFINTGSHYETVHWDFGDGASSNEPHPAKHTYKDTGTYLIRMLTNADGPCPDSTDLWVHIHGTSADSIIPINVFTPDHDQLNDCFHFGGVLNTCSEIKISIYDRWGIKMFETTDFNTCWNGKMNNTGAVCPEGTYFYICEYKGATSTIRPRFSGTITLIRN